jgi:hypothetical protein
MRLSGSVVDQSLMFAGAKSKKQTYILHLKDSASLKDFKKLLETELQAQSKGRDVHITHSGNDSIMLVSVTERGKAWLLTLEPNLQFTEEQPVYPASSPTQ